MNNNIVTPNINNQYTYKINNNASKFDKRLYNKTNNTISFKATNDKNIFNKFIDWFQSIPGINNYVCWCKNKWNKLDDGFAFLADTKPMKKIVNWAAKKLPKDSNKMSNSQKLNQAFMIAFSACLQSCSIFNIAKDKNIPKERKETLMVNTGLTFVIPTIGALFVDNIINKQFDKLTEHYKKINQGNPKLKKETIENASKGIKNFKSIFVFALMYKFGSTLIALPIADKVTDYMRKKGFFKGAKQNQNIANVA
ncbi:MAG: hypothetical protein BHW64_00200 [Candidatus Melainabacteria bacterium LEY3_CP_29_8]|nr:MAG: hypothetical protein BHW64_00200 [Candidatus Melainabacteria bacterium LEY3_CP_29_8]